LLAKLTGPFSTPPEDAADIALAQEIRTWLRSLPPDERTDAVGRLVNKGDVTALRAVLTAPSYLTGLDETELAYIRDDAAKAADPERYRTLQSLRKAGEVAERAVEGVARYLHQEATAAPPPPHSRPAALPPVQPPPDPDTVAAVMKATEEALARQASLSGAA
jgi:hypothetical protein